MNWIINFMNLILIVIEYMSFFYVILRKELRKYSSNITIWNGIILLCFIGVSFGNWNFVSIFVIGIIFSACEIYLIFQISISETIKLRLVAFPALSILESIVDYFLKMVFHFEETERTIAYMIVIVLGLWLYYVILGRKLEREAFQMSGWIWLIIAIVMFLLVGMISYFTYILKEVATTLQDIVGLVLLTAGGFAIFILMYVMLYYFNTKQKYQLQSDMLEQYNEQQRQYFEELLQKEQETRQFRHDITSELLQIQNFYNKCEYKEAEQYINEMLHEIKVINKKGYNVGNEIINTILNSYFAPIEAECEIKIKGFIDDEIKVSRRDLCVIISNLVKNAVEAVGKCSEGNKKIIFEISQGKQFLNIKVKNTAQCNTIITGKNYPVTGKEDKKLHGLGIQNIIKTSKKYNGRYEYKIENGYYIAQVYLEI